MKIKHILILLLSLSYGQLTAQKWCQFYVKAAQSALEKGQLNEAETNLNNATICNIDKNETVKRSIEKTKVQLTIKKLAASKPAAPPVPAPTAPVTPKAPPIPVENIGNSLSGIAQVKLYQSTAHRLAFTSLLEKDARLKALLALQSYKFYHRAGSGAETSAWDIWVAMTEAAGGKNILKQQLTKVPDGTGSYGLVLDRRNDLLQVTTPLGNVRSYNVIERKELQTGGAETNVAQLDGNVYGRKVQLSSDGELAAYVVNEKDIYVSHVLGSQGLDILYHCPSRVVAYSFAGDGKKLLVANAEDQVDEWDLASQRNLNSFQSAYPIKQVWSHPKSGRVFAALEAGGLVYQALGDNLEKLSDLNGFVVDFIKFVDIDRHEAMMVGTQTGLVLGFWLLHEGDRFQPRLFRVIAGNATKISSLEVFQPQNKRGSHAAHTIMATAEANGVIQIWNLGDTLGVTSPIILKTGKESISGLAFDATGAVLYAISSTGELFPIHIGMDKLSGQLCEGITVDLTNEEWQKYILGGRIPFEATCLPRQASGQ